MFFARGVWGCVDGFGESITPCCCVWVFFLFVLVLIVLCLVGGCVWCVLVIF